METVLSGTKNSKYTQELDSNHPQQQLLQEGFSRLTDLSYEPFVSEPKIENAPSPVETLHHNKVSKSSIKFQDRNKKLDFKKNFRDENLKVDGCFHRESSSNSSSEAVAPPKKKWIRHYMTGKE